MDKNIGDENLKVLFKLPFMVYFLCWDRQVKEFSLARKRFVGEKNQDAGENPWYWDEL